MLKVAKCALCGKEPFEKQQYMQHPVYQCCGVTCSHKTWNRVQAAIHAEKELKIKCVAQEEIIAANAYRIMTLENAVELRFVEFAHDIIRCIRQGTTAEELLEKENAKLRAKIERLCCGVG